MAHMDGSTPDIIIEPDAADAHPFGCLVCFFGNARGLFGCMPGVNHFDRPFAIAHKKIMFVLPGKNGFEVRLQDS